MPVAGEAAAARTAGAKEAKVLGRSSARPICLVSRPGPSFARPPSRDPSGRAGGGGVRGSRLAPSGRAPHHEGGAAGTTPREGAAGRAPKGGAAGRAPEGGSGRHNPKGGAAGRAPKGGGGRHNPEGGGGRHNPEGGGGRHNPPHGEVLRGTRSLEPRTDHDPTARHASPFPRPVPVRGMRVLLVRSLILRCRRSRPRRARGGGRSASAAQYSFTGARRSARRGGFGLPAPLRTRGQGSAPSPLSCFSPGLSPELAHVPDTQASQGQRAAGRSAGPRVTSLPTAGVRARPAGAAPNPTHKTPHERAPLRAGMTQGYARFSRGG